MTKELERDLGLVAVLAISIGAMIGSGIFILPALAIEIAGPAVILAYVVAALLVLPAALSKSEMATAMPEAGGTYIYIERGMGPLLGTIAGLGTWFSLAFKGALALVGGVPYLVLLLDLPVKPVALGLAVVLVLVNLLGAKQTGRLQTAIVSLMLLALGWFTFGSIASVESTRYAGTFTGSVDGLLAATGLVFVSYAGVTKIASVAEEIERPGRNIPIGILGSLAFTTLLYVLIVVVMVGVAPADEIAASLTPVAVAAERTLARPGVIAVVFAAVLALVSTANAGILSSSRYPFAMSRDDLAPAIFQTISDRFKTPTAAITITGSVMLVLIAFVPILEIAKLASAFQILVFVLINASVVAFRESDLEWYDPEFESPLYPAIQIVGAIGGLVLLTQMGGIAIFGSVGIVASGFVWYVLYARPRIDREGLAIDTIRRSVGRSVIDRTRDAVEGSDGYEVLVAVTEGTGEERERTLLRTAADIARRHDGGVTVVQFDTVPDQVPLDYASEVQSPADVQFERRTSELCEQFDVPIHYGEIVSHDVKHAVVNFAQHDGADVLLMEREPQRLRTRLFGNGVEWVLRHAPCDVVLVEDRAFGSVDEVTVLADRSPYDPSKVKIADAIATELGAAIRLVYAVDATATADQRETIDDYQTELTALCSAPVRREIVEITNPVIDLLSAVEDADFLAVGLSGGLLQGSVFSRTEDELIDGVSCTALGVHAHESGRPGLLGRLVERLLF